MSHEHKKRVEEAVYAYCRNQLPKEKRTNKKPEEEVCKDLAKFFVERGFFINRYESKAKQITDNSGNTRYRSSGLSFGTPDFLGCSPSGAFVACEVKAPGCRVASRLSKEQREFLISVIRRGGFGICTDSVDHFQKTYTAWMCRDKTDGEALLMCDLPGSGYDIEEFMAPVDPPFEEY